MIISKNTVSVTALLAVGSIALLVTSGCSSGPKEQLPPGMKVTTASTPRVDPAAWKAAMAQKKANDGDPAPQ